MRQALWVASADQSSRAAGVAGNSAARVRRYRANIQAELDRAAVYRAMADAERHPQLAGSFRRLAEVEGRHAEFWRGQLGETDSKGAPQRPSVRARLLARLAARFGSRLVSRRPRRWRLPNRRPTSISRRRTARPSPPTSASTRAFSTPLSEASTARVTASMLARMLGRRRGVSGNALRAAVLGAERRSRLQPQSRHGCRRAGLPTRTVLITGVAGLLAGAFSMAMGEWISVQSSRELHQRQLDREAEEIATDPEHERAELTSLYRRRASPSMSPAARSRVMSDEDAALEAMAREELGFDPKELGGSAWVAAIASFARSRSGRSCRWSHSRSSVGTWRWGSACWRAGSRCSGSAQRSAPAHGPGTWRSAFRQLAIGLGAAAVTYGAGYLWAPPRRSRRHSRTLGTRSCSAQQARKEMIRPPPPSSYGPGTGPTPGVGRVPVNPAPPLEIACDRDLRAAQASAPSPDQPEHRKHSPQPSTPACPDNEEAAAGQGWIEPAPSVPPAAFYSFPYLNETPRRNTESGRSCLLDRHVLPDDLGNSQIAHGPPLSLRHFSPPVP